MVLGSICIDLAAFFQTPPTPGQTIIGDDFALVLGGKGSNQAIAAALAGSKSTQTISGGTGKGRRKIIKGFSTYGTHCRYQRSGDQIHIKTKGQPGECRFKVTQAGNKLFNEVESPSITIQVEK